MNENFLPYAFGNPALVCGAPCPCDNFLSTPYVRVSTLDHHRLVTVIKRLGDKTVIINRPELRQTVASVLEGKHPDLRVWRAIVHSDRLIFELVDTRFYLAPTICGRITILNPKKLELCLELLSLETYHVTETLLYGASNNEIGSITKICVWSEDTNSVQKYEYYSNTSQMALHMLFNS